jgi:site-specific DNA-methyltransferase (adenine-specific)
MPTFRDLRSAAGLTVSDTCQLLGIDPRKIETYETGQVAPRPRELQVLKGLATTRQKRETVENASCESESRAASISGHKSGANRGASHLKSRILEQPVIDGSDQLAESPVPDASVQPTLIPKKAQANEHKRPVKTIQRNNDATTPSGCFRVMCGDALGLLKTLPPSSVDMCMTSPPYWGHREYDVSGIGQETTHETYIDRLCAVLQEVKRVLKPKGSLWLNIGDSYDAKNLVGIPWRVALRLVDQHGWILRNDVIWNKVKGAPDNSRDKLRNIHEHVFHFVKQKNYFYDADAIRSKPQEARVINGSVISATGVSGVRYKRQIELSTALSPAEKINAIRALNAVLDDVRARRLADFRMIIRGQQRTTHSDRDNVSGRAKEVRDKGFYFLKYHPNGSKPSDVWDILPEDTQKRETHFAPYPADLCRIPILATCPDSGVVLDPFCGTGTTLLVAKQCGRNGIGIDISPAYVDIMRQRLSDLLTDVS